jgi:outer membrane protein assembly factor BamB
MSLPRRRFCAILAASGAVISQSASLLAADAPPKGAKSAADWPQWRGPNRDGISTDSGLNKDWRNKPPKLLWTSDGMGAGFSSLSIAGDRIYTIGDQASNQAVACANLADGKVLWTSPITDSVPKFNHGGSRSTPTLDGERLFVIPSTGRIICLKTSDGKEVWSKDFRTEWGGRPPNWGFAESPLVDGDRVLCTPGGSAAMMVALNKTTGKEIFRTEYPTLGDSGKDGAGYSSIVISNACGLKQYVQLVGKGVVGVRASDGKFLWGYNQVANRTATIPTPIIDGDYVFVSSGYGTGAALLKLSKAGTGIRCDEQYFLDGKTMQNHHGQMILKDGYIYCGHGHNNGYPICVEINTGKIAWGGNQRGVGSGSAAIAFADDHLVFRYESGEVALIEATPSEYRLKGSFKPPHATRPCWSHPVILAGRMYLRDNDKLMCYDVRA